MPVFRGSRRHSPSDVERRIRAALQDLRPLLRVESFAVDLVGFEPESGTVRLRVDGGCPDCELTPATLVRGIEAHLRRNVPEVESVEAETT
jgi:NFU1 iron-sulfur cluster scaffold homolog, mitochondrial